MSEIIQTSCSWSKTSGETDLGRNVCTQDNSSQDNSPHIKLTLRQLAPDSETNSPQVVILHNVLKFVETCFKTSVKSLNLYRTLWKVNHDLFSYNDDLTWKCITLCITCSSFERTNPYHLYLFWRGKNEPFMKVLWKMLSRCIEITSYI